MTKIQNSMKNFEFNSEKNKQYLIFKILILQTNLKHLCFEFEYLDLEFVANLCLQVWDLVLVIWNLQVSFSEKGIR
jgi:hypothetical protein